jgi:hypothetical protein
MTSPEDCKHLQTHSRLPQQLTVLQIADPLIDKRGAECSDVYSVERYPSSGSTTEASLVYGLGKLLGVYE